MKQTSENPDMYAVPGENSIIDTINPETGLCEFGEEHEH